MEPERRRDAEEFGVWCGANTLRIGGESAVLFHGSKSGILGAIRPIGRERCDFGRGFYMGTERSQPLTLICSFPSAKLYTLRVSLTGLRILDLEVGLDWAFLIAYHRGKMAAFGDSDISKRFAAMAGSCDMIVGDIASDRMFVVLDRFFAGEITDGALIHSLSVLKLGKQYVALAEKACRQIEMGAVPFRQGMYLSRLSAPVG